MASQALIKDFEDLIGKENVFTSEADRQSYSFDSAVLEPWFRRWCSGPRPPSSWASASRNFMTTAFP